MITGEMFVQFLPKFIWIKDVKFSSFPRNLVRSGTAEIITKHFTYTHIPPTFSRLTSSHWKSTIDGSKRRQEKYMKIECEEKRRAMMKNNRKAIFIARKETQKSKEKSNSLWRFFYICDCLGNEHAGEWACRSTWNEMNGSALSSETLLGCFFASLFAVIAVERKIP